MKLKQLLTKTFLLAAGLIVGSSQAWGEVTETYDFYSFATGDGYFTLSEKSYTNGDETVYLANNCTIGDNTIELNKRFAFDQVSKSNSDGWRFRNGGTFKSGLVLQWNKGTGYPCKISIVNLNAGDKIKVTYDRDAKRTNSYLYFNNTNAKIEDTPVTLESTMTSGTEYTIVADGQLDLNAPNNNIGIHTVFITINVDAYTSRMASAKTKATTLSNTVMNSTVKTALTTALASTYVNMEAASITNENIDAYIAALEALETAVANAQTSADNFTILNNLIGNANTAPIDGYTAPSGAGAVYTSDADVDPVALAAAVRAAVVEAGTATPNTNISAIIVNNSFEMGNTLGWTTVASNDTGARAVGESGSTYYTSGADGHYLFNTWSKGTPIIQNIGTLRAGQYKVAAKVASNGATMYFTMNNEHSSGTVTSDAAVFIDAEYTFTIASETDVTIGLVGGAGDGSYIAEGHWWYKADKFTLTYIGQDELALAKASLEAEIATATALKNSWEPKVGTTPFKYDATNYNALAAQIVAAQQIVDGGSNDYTTYTNAETGLETAEANMASSTVNKPDENKYYRLYLANNGISTNLNLNLLKGSTQWLSVSSTPYAIRFTASGNNFMVLQDLV